MVAAATPALPESSSPTKQVPAQRRVHALRRLLATPAPPRNRIIHPRPGGITSPVLAPFTDYLQRRWRAGCTNGCQISRELVERDYTGGRTLVLAAIRSWRPAKPPKSLLH